MTRKIGAPTGGRVHWLIMFLSREFKRAYKLRFDYEYHNYHFTRYNEGSKTPRDEFIIIRTSRSCFRAMYFNYVNTYFVYFSEETAREMAEHVSDLFEKIKRSERQGGI